LLVRALSTQAWDEACRCVHYDADEPWDALRFQAALAPFFQDYERIVFDPRAKQAHHTRLVESGPRQWQVTQVLVDNQGDDIWHIEGTIDLSGEVALDEPLVSIRRIGT
jgi:hypothetical protein